LHSVEKNTIEKSPKVEKTTQIKGT